VTTYSHIVIIYNPSSSGPSAANARKLQRQLQQKLPTVSCDCIATEHAGHAETLAYEYARQYKTPLIISASGDGGYNEIINGAMRASHHGHQPICAVLPSGNANDHSKTLHSQPLLKLIIAGNTHNIDLLHASIRQPNDVIERYAHSYMGLGLSPSIAAEMNRIKPNSLQEKIVVLKMIFRFKSFTIAVNNQLLMLDSLVFSNISRMAKVFSLSSTSDVRDGAFELSIFPHSRKRTLLFNILKAIVFHLKPQSVARYQFSTVTPLSMQLDGEVLQLPADTSVTIAIATHALTTLL
jgi:diacylglycerol kinase (ATP)